MTKAAELAKMGEVLTNSQIGGRRNIVINGAMQVAQRGTSSTGLGANATTYNTVDRFYHSASGSTAGRFTMEQSTDAPNGFSNSIKLSCTTADTSIAADEALNLGTVLEGQNVQQLKKGTSDAEKFTVSFYVKGNASATYSIEIYDGDNNRQLSQTFSVTTSWTRVILTFAGDTTGALGNDNGASLYFQLWLHAGSTYNGGSLNTSWAAVTQNQRASSSSTSFFDSTDRTFFITGFQVEVGSQATPFEHRSFGEELELCKRYYQSIGDRSSNHEKPLYETAAQDATDSTGTFHFFPPMRATPTLETTGTAADYKIYTNNSNYALASVPSFGSGSTQCGFVSAAVSSGLTAGEVCHVMGNNDPAFIAFTAEL